jgi:signal transduction histidine kinase
VIYVVGYGIDITERTQFERQLVEAKNAAEEMARLKSAFLANMSHEVRTPLTAIMGFAAVLAEELSGEQRELLEIIKHSSERLLETLNSVLDLARLEANALEVDPKPLELEEELLAAARLYRPLAQKKGLAFKMEMPRREMRAQLDRVCLHRVLSNLLSNAVKFTDAGEVRLALRPVGSEVQIEVSDTGIGIDEAFLPHLFEEFKQESTGLARTHTGSGLGLAITRHLVERMHGRIEVASSKDKGSTFTVTFPAMTTLPVCVTGPEEVSVQRTVCPNTEAVEP